MQIGKHSILKASMALMLMIPIALPFVTQSALYATSNNLILNPSVETASSNASIPLDWVQDHWGSNSASFSYLNNNAEDGKRSVYVSVAKYVSGDAKWMFNAVGVSPKTTYTYSDYYKANVATETDVEYLDAAGNTTWVYLGTLNPATAWTHDTFTFTTPANVKTLTVVHLIYANGWVQTDNFSLTQVQAQVTSVSITSPQNNATVSGVINLTAQTVGSIKSVQYMLDNSNVGNALTTAPYTYAWDTTKVTNGKHSLMAVATDAANKVVDSTVVYVTVTNTINAQNLIPNPMLTQVDPANASQPLNWSTESWGTNTPTFSYLPTGYNGSKSVSISMKNYQSGDAKWVYTLQNATAGDYKFTTYYKSSIDVQVTVREELSDGTEYYLGLDPANAASTWSQYTKEFFLFSNVKQITIFMFITGNGTLTTSNYSLVHYTPTGWNKPIVTLDFDNGFEINYTTVLPILNQYGFKSTQLISTVYPAQEPDQVYKIKDFYTTGHEIASHTIDHVDLTTLTQAQVMSQLVDSKNWLEQNITNGNPVTSFATPFGMFNAAVTNDIKQVYGNNRNTDEGINWKDNFDPYNILVENVMNTTTPAQFESWVQKAVSENAWLVVVYHQVTTSDNDPDQQPYDTTPAYFDAEMVYLHNQKGVSIETQGQALQDVSAQMK